jgi:hypothetical protein
MPDKTHFVGQWVNWDGVARIEQELFVDGRFEGIVFDEEQGKVFGTAKGHWELVGEAIHWRYVASENIPLPKKVQVNPIVQVDTNHLRLRENSRWCTDWYRKVESEETSTNFDYEQVQPFLERIARLIDSGFGSGEIATLMKKAQRLRPEQTYQVVFPITFEGNFAPFHIRVFMDDVDAPDVYLYAPVKLTRQIDNEISRLDSKTGG